MPKAIKPTDAEVDAYIAEHKIEIAESGAMLLPWRVEIPVHISKALNARSNAAHRAWVAAGRPLPTR